MYPGKKLKLKEIMSAMADFEDLKIHENEIFDPSINRKRSNSTAGSFTSLDAPPELDIENRIASKDDSAPRINATTESLRDRLKASLNRGGDISDIDKIFEHVLNESKRVNESLKQVTMAESVNDPRKSFLKFYETASKGEMEDEMKDFIAVESEHKIVKSETYYCTKHGRVKGVLTVADSYLMYDPLYWEENNKYDQETLGSKFQACIDIKDIVNVDVIKLPNETAMYVLDEESRQWYLYDYYLQLSVSVVNAKTLKKMLGGRKSSKKARQLRKRAIATVFFRFSHRDKDGNPLKNKAQSSIVEIIKDDIVRKQKLLNYEKEQQEKTKDQDDDILNKEDEILNKEDEPSKEEENDRNSYVEYQSSTYIPYYDKIPRDTRDFRDDDYELVNEEEVSVSNSSVVDNTEPRKLEERKSSIDTNPLRLPKYENHSRFMPIWADKSKVMSDTQIMVIARLLPPLFRMREWKKVYSVDEDGVSLQTFYKCAHNQSSSLLFIEDSKGFKFGAYWTEDWKPHKYFYGTGESFLFTFKDTEEDVEFYKWSGHNDHIQFSDENSIAVGGADGKFALYIRNNFYNGVSNKWRTFNNETLSSSEDFLVKHLELWSFDY